MFKKLISVEPQIDLKMKDSLENFITQNRESFDREVPSLKVWAEIDKKMGTKSQETKPRSLWRHVWMAASILFLLTAGGLIGMQITKGISNDEMANKDILPKEYQEMESFYQGQVQEKVAQLANYNEDPSINEDLQQIDDFLMELKGELKNTPKGSEEQIVNALISNYKTKIAILERVLDRIQSTNQETIKKSEENERIDI